MIASPAAASTAPRTTVDAGARSRPCSPLGARLAGAGHAGRPALSAAFATPATPAMSAAPPLTDDEQLHARRSMAGQTTPGPHGNAGGVAGVEGFADRPPPPAYFVAPDGALALLGPLMQYRGSTQGAEEGALKALRQQVKTLRGVINSPVIRHRFGLDADTRFARDQRIAGALTLLSTAPALRTVDMLRTFRPEDCDHVDVRALADDLDLLTWLTYSPGARGVLEVCDEFLAKSPPPCGRGYGEIFRALVRCGLRYHPDAESSSALADMLELSCGLSRADYTLLFQALLAFVDVVDLPRAFHIFDDRLEEWAIAGRYFVLGALHDVGMRPGPVSAGFQRIITGGPGYSRRFRDDAYLYAHWRWDYEADRHVFPFGFDRVYSLLVLGFSFSLDDIQARWLDADLGRFHAKDYARAGAAPTPEQVEWLLDLRGAALKSVFRLVALMSYSPLIKIGGQAPGPFPEWGMREYVMYLYPWAARLRTHVQRLDIPEAKQLRNDTYAALVELASESGHEGVAEALAWIGQQRKQHCAIL